MAIRPSDTAVGSPANDRVHWPIILKPLRPGNVFGIFVRMVAAVGLYPS